MSTTVKWSDGTKTPVILAIAAPVYAQGQQRAAIELQIATSALTIDQLDTLSRATAAAGKITLTDDTGEYVHDNYSIRTELAVKAVEVTPATSTAPAATADRLCVTLAQLTYLEVQQAAQAAATAAQADAIAELSILMAGGNA